MPAIFKTGKRPRKGTHYPSRLRDPQWPKLSEHRNPAPLTKGDKFATLFEMKDYIHEALQPEPRRIVHRYKTIEAAIADAIQINDMKDTKVIVIEYDGKSDYVPRGYRDTHTVWREKKSEKVLHTRTNRGRVLLQKGSE